ncbi:O-linked N-acetylglucosamine transferase, SPINDLY family protein [Hassallia byssoidea VB512170]|uniref:O-linked N-acetylglucosamine transferase, SPINDLY family protein n=1 Tax=Hassallia byssoidea VB512170 TaxID=1304833 RepID=A0A846H8W8_9CYAN|nr:O-linked N-acetylglucosamine transferase [Hassalia byssoidea]NEU72931.1 O-linked N-acetylglucosamine transferase, SPINDLY family protein [Hassalia byssoidea VB512170]
MNTRSLLNINPAALQQAYDFIIQGNYLLAANLYEQAIDTEPNIKCHYWYLGLTLLLQGQEVEAQTTWFMVMMEGEPEEVDSWNQELVEILETEAKRREALEEYSVAWKIRHQIKEIYPQDIHNLLHLVQLSVKLEIYTGDELTELGLIEILQSEPDLVVNIQHLMQVLRSILTITFSHPALLDFVQVSLKYIKNNLEDFYNILLPAAMEIAYSQKQSAIAARLGEMYLQLEPENPDFLLNLSGFYQNAGEYAQGIETAKKSYYLLKELADLIFANRQIMRGLMTAGGYWQEAYETHYHQESLLKSLIAEQPTYIKDLQVSRLYNANYFAPYIEDNPRKNRQFQNQLMQLCQKNTENFAKQKVERYRDSLLNRKQSNKSSDRRLKIGYVSHCLKTHSVGWLARWLFEHHDSENFEINAYCLFNQPIFDPLYEWYLEKVSKAYNSNNVFQIAEQIHQDEIDILIDLDSITLDLTCHIMAIKPAPVQATWLGLDASGIPTIDYYIADPYVLPETAQEYYSEKIWRLPQTYIAVDGFEIGVPTLRRDDLNIESDAVVYICTQRGFKRHPDTMRLQLQIIKEVPNSYFLIKGMADEKSTKNFVYQLAEEEGVDCSKLRFLPEVLSEATHRANLGIADIVLDTYPYNGATTTLETLWMCIPMVTRVGEQFAARNSYTMMMNAGITEGIAWTNKEYVEWGVRLGKDEALRQKIAVKLKASRKTAPLWNAKQFTREMEKAYQQMWQRYIEGC